MKHCNTSKTVFGTLKDFKKGKIDIINDNPKNYAFSNVFEVASHAKPYERIAVAKNFKYVIEIIYAKGMSEWFASRHDEFALIMDGSVQINFLKLSDKEKNNLPLEEGAHQFNKIPAGNKMGLINAKQGHMALLPQGSAYQFYAEKPSVVLVQTIQGQLTIEKWKQICQMA
jgi:hypothetical protein